MGKPNPSAVAAFEGSADAALGLGDDEVGSCFNMYNWFALDPAGQLRGPYMNLPETGAWPWTEGVPADNDICDKLPGVEPVRVVLIGPTPYNRRMHAGVSLVKLTADCKVKKVLSRAKVDEYID